MNAKTELWDKLGKTDPAHTKAFTRGGGFKGTAIKPMWSYRRMTEEFGPCGKFWGVGEPSFQVVPAGDEILVYCTVSVWWANDTSERNVVYGVGGDKVIAKFSSGSRTDDEAFKKAFTDAVTNALKLIGVGADVHMGMFDDNKYVNTIREEFAEPPAKSSASLKKPDENGDDAWARLMKALEPELLDCKTLMSLEALRIAYRKKVAEERWPAAWKHALKDRFDSKEDEIMREMEKEEA